MERELIVIDGIEHQVKQFSVATQQAIRIYNIFTDDLEKANLEVLKTTSALKTIGDQITAQARIELSELAVIK